MLGILRRVFQFSDWQQHHPLEPPPGDMLDASFDAQDSKIAELDAAVSSLRRADGALQNGIVTADSLNPTFRRVLGDEIADRTRKIAADAQNAGNLALDAAQKAIQAKNRAENSEISVKTAEKAVFAAKDAVLRRASGLLAESTALSASFDRAAVDLRDLSASTADGVGEAEAWAETSRLWAEHMPDTIPDNVSLSELDASGDHWSSRWWANYASTIVSEGLGIPGPAGPAGAPGAPGAPGAAGPGVPPGGSTGQVLTKVSATDFNSTWMPGGSAPAWADITGKPTTFPPTLPIAQSGVTNLTTDQAAQDSAIAGKAPTVHSHAQSDITNLTTDLAAKLNTSAYTAADVLAKIITVDGAGSGLDADLLDGNSSAFYASASSVTAKLDASAYTAADVLTKTKTVDGTGSGLDADLLDGQEAAAFAAASHSHTAANITDFSEAVDDRVNGLLVAGSNVTLTYNDVANTMTVAATGGGAGVTDGDKGDVVVSASGATWMFDSAVVTAAAKTVLDDATTADMLTTLGAVAKAGDTMTGKLNLPATTAAAASLNISGGVSTSVNPTTPVEGDLWVNGVFLMYRGSGSTHTTVNLANTQTIAGAKTFSALITGTLGVKAYSATAIPAGGTAGAGFTLSSATNFGVFFGSGAPTLSAAQGSIYLRSDGTGTNTRVYVNTNGTTGWAAMSVIATGTSAPSSPATGDVWIDTT